MSNSMTHILSEVTLDESFASCVSIDGVYFDKNYSTKSPTLFLIGNEPNKEHIFEAMEDVLWANNIGMTHNL